MIGMTAGTANIHVAANATISTVDPDDMRDLEETKCAMVTGTRDSAASTSIGMITSAENTSTTNQ